MTPTSIQPGDKLSWLTLIHGTVTALTGRVISVTGFKDDPVLKVTGKDIKKHEYSDIIAWNDKTITWL